MADQYGREYECCHFVLMNPQAEEELKFLRNFFLGGVRLGVEVVNLAVLASLLRATTKKVINFLRKKVHVSENSGYAYVFTVFSVCRVVMSLYVCAASV